jgi:hypothetical protein
MLLTSWLASDGGDHLWDEADATLTWASMAFPDPFLLFRAAVIAGERFPQDFVLITGSREGWQLAANDDAPCR